MTVRSDKSSASHIIILSNVYDDQYPPLHAEEVPRCLSSAKRCDLFHALEVASGRKVVVLSSPPQLFRKWSRAFKAPLACRFSTHEQFFCTGVNLPKIRFPISWILYTLHVLRHVRNGDILIIDNYELVYVLAARITRLFRRITIILDYEDGKHLIDRGIIGMISSLAEKLGRKMIDGCIIASPGLRERVPEGIPTEVVPGFCLPSVGTRLPEPGASVRFLFSGSLDQTRGGDLLYDAVKLLPEEGWRLDVTGAIGGFAEKLSQLGNEDRFRGKVSFHGSLPGVEYLMLVRECHVGLNCQKSSDPISEVTFPSKVFSYLSQGLHVISTRASHVEAVCGQGCLYLDAETPEALAAMMIRVIHNPSLELSKIDTQEVSKYYSIESIVERLALLLQKAITQSE